MNEFRSRDHLVKHRHLRWSTGLFAVSATQSQSLPECNHMEARDRNSHLERRSPPPPFPPRASDAFCHSLEVGQGVALPRPRRPANVPGLEASRGGAARIVTVFAFMEQAGGGY